MNTTLNQSPKPTVGCKVGFGMMISDKLWNPKGIQAFSPGLSAQRATLGQRQQNDFNPNGVAAADGFGYNPFRVETILGNYPR